MSGRVLRYDVPMLSDECSIVFRYNDGDSASETGCADVVNPAEYQHMFLLNYFLGDDEYDVLLTKGQFDTFEELVKNEPLGGYYHYLNDGVGYKW